jgi:hypothetical protein
MGLWLREWLQYGQGREDVHDQTSGASSRVD